MPVGEHHRFSDLLRGAAQISGDQKGETRRGETRYPLFVFEFADQSVRALKERSKGDVSAEGAIESGNGNSDTNGGEAQRNENAATNTQSETEAT